ncbi:hypothetical protein BsWGS_17175 [Bradybaena similaris]
MGQLSLVDDKDPVPQEEVLMQYSRKFILAGQNKKDTFLVKKQVTITQQMKTMSGMSFPKMDSEKDEVQSSSTCQTCALPTQLSRTEGEEDVIIIEDEDDEVPGSSQQAQLVSGNRKRKVTDVVEDNSGKNSSKRSRKNSCEILKDELRKSISTINGAKQPLLATPNGAKPILDHSQVAVTSRDTLLSHGHTALLHGNHSQDKVGLNCVQGFKSGVCDNQGNTSSCTVKLDSGPKKAKIVKPVLSAEIICIDDDDDDTNISSGFHLEKTGEVHKCDNNGTENHKKGFAQSSSSSSGSGVSVSRAATSKWILHDKDKLCLKRLFDPDGVSAISPTVLNGSRHESNQDLRQAGTAVRLPTGTAVRLPTITAVRLPTVADIPDWMYVAVDCEMVGVGFNGIESVVARCSIVDYNGAVIYDKYIRPSETITDYRTQWSGIRPVHMRTAVPISKALRDIKECLAHKVVIGHAVYNDFRVLKLNPEPYFVRDTLQCSQLVEMANLPFRGKSLKGLSEKLLGRKIQVGNQGHCSVEDARATLDLFKLVRHSWEPILYLKWSKNVDIFNKVARFVDQATRQRNTNNSADDFLNDMFWPSHITE